MSELIHFAVTYVMWHMPALVLRNVSHAVLSEPLLNVVQGAP